MRNLIKTKLEINFFNFYFPPAPTAAERGPSEGGQEARQLDMSQYTSAPSPAAF